MQTNLMPCAAYGLSTDRLTPTPSTFAAMLAALLRRDGIVKVLTVLLFLSILLIDPVHLRYFYWYFLLFIYIYIRGGHRLIFLI